MSASSPAACAAPGAGSDKRQRKCRQTSPTGASPATATSYFVSADCERSVKACQDDFYEDIESGRNARKGGLTGGTQVSAGHKAHQKLAPITVAAPGRGAASASQGLAVPTRPSRSVTPDSSASEQCEECGSGKRRHRNTQRLPVMVTTQMVLGKVGVPQGLDDDALAEITALRKAIGKLSIADALAAVAHSVSQIDSDQHPQAASDLSHVARVQCIAYCKQVQRALRIERRKSANRVNSSEKGRGPRGLESIASV
eukprot:CAMPEP_0204296952 /NCGR_PEP_ID=MMETSP0468-20130131/72300_1 /ASSEMBLY_ACC=CAM_ASM_000383 /TAXON_ID=2969 /ORGANISM="Oxyrrhis marina" /LENGTH=255 /DNA_ID=CAMNT_0051275707 /DNA_START=236 /DNA_END=1004 /DNA_ORIENTATION=-